MVLNNNLSAWLGNPIKQVLVGKIYLILCEDCLQKCISQTRSNIGVRAREYVSYVHYARPEKSATVKYC